MRAGLAVLLAVAGVGCRGLYANMAGHSVANDQLAITSFHGRTSEKHMLTGGEGALVKDVWYQKLSKVRVEVVSPKELAGQLFVYDGEQVSMWWPSARLGLRMRGVAAPHEREQHALIREQMARAWRRYAMTQLGPATIAGQATVRWNAEPRDREPHQHGYDAWLDRRFALPLRLELREEAARPWYEMEYEALEYGVEPPERAFAFDFPAGATVLDWDLAADGVSPDEAQRRVDFPLLTPARRHVDKVVLDTHGVPFATLVMNEGARWLTVTESRRAMAVVPPTGKPVRVGEATGYLDFLGTYSTLTWEQGETRLTLITNLPYDEAIAVACSVEPAQR